MRPSTRPSLGIRGNEVRLQGLTIDGDVLAALDDETAAAVIAYRVQQLREAGFGLQNALTLACRTDRSLKSIISPPQRQERPPKLRRPQCRCVLPSLVRRRGLRGPV